MTDLRYVFVKCVTCGEDYQDIDFGCAQHRNACINPQRADAVSTMTLAQAMETFGNGPDGPGA